MILRNSMTSILRTKKKTALFFLLIFLLSVFLGLGISVWAANRAMMAECEENYDTIAVFSYMGAGYPDETNLEDETISNLQYLDILQETEAWAGIEKNVLFAAPSSRCLGWVKGYQPKNMTAPFGDAGIYVLKNVYAAAVFQNEDGPLEYMGEVARSIYSYGEHEKLLVHFCLEEGNFQPEYDKQYLVHGSWYGDVFSVSELEEVTADSELLDKESVYGKQAAFYEGANRLLPVRLMNRPEYAKVFHQGEAELAEGEFYEAGQGEQVCLVTKDIANALSLEVGDALPLHLVPVETGNIYESFRTEEDYPAVDYQITGIIETTTTYKNSIYIPLQEEIDGTYGFEAGWVLLKNGSGDDFLSQVEPELPGRMVVDIYDQGYTQVMDSMKSLQQTTRIILGICMLAAVTVLILFGYLFVYKQRETVVIMKNLGTERSKIYAYLMISSGTLAAAASFLGAMAGYGIGGIFQKRVMDFLEAGIGNGIDNRYSYLAEGLVKEYSRQGGASVGYFLAAAVCLTLAGVGICLAFAENSIRPPRVKKPKKERALKREHRSSAQNGVILRFALLSIQRGGMRTAVVCLVSGVLMLVFSVLSYTGQRYEMERQALIENAKIEGYFTNTTGDRISNLGIDAAYPQQLEDSGYIENIETTLYREYFHYYYQGIPVHADGRTGTVLEIEIPDPYEHPYAYEKFINELTVQPCLLYTTDFSAVGELFYSDRPKVEWKDGYDESVLEKKYEQGELTPCLISEQMQQEQGISFGDTVRVTVVVGSMYAVSYTEMDFEVVGTYAGDGAENHILLPFEAFRPWVLSEGRGEQKEYEMDTVRFTVTDAGKLTEFKDYLQSEGFSQLRERKEIRSVIVLKDTQYQKTKKQLEEKIKYMNLLYPVLYVLTCIISFLVSYLLMRNRKGELALMQSMGTGRWKVFCCFFLEQTVLSLTGIGTVWLIVGLVTGFTAGQLICMAVCLGCYLAGCGLLVSLLNRSSVLMLLRDKE